VSILRGTIEGSSKDPVPRMVSEAECLPVTLTCDTTDQDILSKRSRLWEETAVWQPNKDEEH